MVKARWENKFSAKIKAIQTDNGGEYMGSVFARGLLEAGVEHRRSVAYAHQQNGKAERGIWTIEGRALAAMNQANLSAGYFGEAVLTVGYLWNLTGTRVLRVFSCRCFARIPPERRIKNGAHSSQALFMGYPDGVKGWRLRDCATGTFFNSRDVIFDEESVMRTKDLTDSHRLSQSLADPSSSSSLVPSPSGIASPPEIIRSESPEQVQIVPRRSGRSRVDSP